MRQGVHATTGEQIGPAVGVLARTVWRYFPSKESCVRPLFSAGIEMLAGCPRDWRPGRPLVAGPERTLLGPLVRHTRTEPGLRAVWLQTYGEAEPACARALAERAGLSADDPRAAIQAAMFNAALRAAVEHCAWRAAGRGAEEDELEVTVRSASAAVAEGLR
ncbi:TetR family transcriptional regulator [Streptomyces sp. TRM70350]|uniref:TetR family transcriptional regulator n=1 Tax=Streptomyces sp. TRM70350 TaxID=2856165 RepID=UPI001C488E75|nr:TetR family transcriptional regulator [Streptomyces sp. TRM70350]MBV7697918.1 TetR/AcrR family transcriptional regulator [Streptomyces sp. TRM70350]